MKQTTLEHPPRLELGPSGWKPDVLPLTLRMHKKRTGKLSFLSFFFTRLLVYGPFGDPNGEPETAGTTFSVIEAVRG